MTFGRIAESFTQWKRQIEHSGVHIPLRSEIVESWRRSARAGIYPEGVQLSLERIPQADLQRRLNKNGELLAVSQPHCDWLSRISGSTDHVVCLCDDDGVVLYSTGNDFRMMDALGMVPGYRWSESNLGTNGIGTSLQLNRPVAVRGPEHFQQAFDSCTSIGAPIHYPRDRIAGAIGFSCTIEQTDPEKLTMVSHLGDVIDEHLAYKVEIHERMRLEEELSRAKQFAEAASAAKSEFLTNVSHDLRTPLHAILGFSQIMEEKWEHLTSEQRIKYCQRIRVNARYQLDLINNILDLARAESGRLPVEISDVDLRMLLEEVVECFSGERQEDVRVRWSVPPPTQPLRTDQGKLKQIITNLFSNAVKCTKRGEVVLRVVTRNGGVPVQIDVIDTGAGIPEGDMERIFEPFHQMTLQGAKWEGSGLGLSICRSLCSLLGYKLVVTSKPGSGSVFSILLESASQGEVVEPMAAD